MSLREQHRLVEAVQTNCHIADAAQAADMTLCIYLLQMREFYRWELGAAPLQSLPREDVGAWLTAREALWNRLEDRPFQPLPVQGRLFDPFDVHAINTALEPHGLVYGAGLTAPGRASFFLGELTAVQQREGVLLRVSGCEHARGLSAPPAALSDGAIFLRQESLLRWLWEKFEAWNLRQLEGPFKAALDAYGYADDGAQAVPRMAQAQGETLVLHELGEARVASLFGAAWPQMRAALNERRTELHLRAVRDLLADCLVTLPTLLERQADASLHFWFANFEGLRAQLFPRLSQAYAAWCDGDGGQALWDALSAGAPHWQRLGEEALALHRAQGAAAAPQIRQLLEAPASVLG
jgi:hypothetical protein